MANELREDILQRHKMAHAGLVDAARKFMGEGRTKAYYVVSQRVGCSDVTVRNYVNGKCSDGFLTEAITKEFKKLKLTK